MRHHFVPRFYLKNFGDEIYCYDKQTGQTHKSNPSDIAVKQDFYGPSNIDNTNPIETAMCNLEGKASAAIKKITETLNYSKLSNEEKSAFCSFVALQLVRTPETRIKTTQTREKLLDEFCKHMGITDFTLRLTQEGKTDAHLDTMSNVYYFAEILGRMSVVVCSNATNIPLWTSDNPVNRYNCFNPSCSGLASEGMAVIMPLSPTSKVILFNLEPHLAKYIDDLLLMDEAHVICANHLQTLQSTRFMYSNTDKFFMVSKYLKSDPASCNVDRDRLSVGFTETASGDFRVRKFRQKPEFWTPRGFDKFSS